MDETERKEIVNFLEQLDKEIAPLIKANDNKKIASSLHKINKTLLTKTFMVGNHVTAADYALYTAIHPLLLQWNDKERSIFMNLTRWFDNVQHLPDVAAANALAPIKITQDMPIEPAKPKPAAAPAGDEKPKDGAAPKKEAAAPKKEGEASAEKKPQDAAAKPAAQEGGKGKGKGQAQPQQGGKGKGGAAAPADKLSATEDISRFDIRVGKIVTCKKHENADSLYIEQIDVGEEAPRQVVSGLVKFIPLDQMQDRRVLLLCNLKPSNLKSVKSFAMVLAASNADHTQVELVEPPEGAPPGERVFCEGFPGDPEKPLKPATLEIVLKDLKTDDKLVATYKGVPFMTSKGACVVKSIANGGIK